VIKRLIAVAAVVVGALAAPAAAQQYPPAQNSLALDDTCVPAGQSVTVTAATFSPGASVAVTLGMSSLGTATAVGEGVATLTATVPSGTPEGTGMVTAVGTGPDGSLTVTAQLTVDADDCAAEPAPAAGSRGGRLPRTGSDATIPLLRIGLALAAIGGILLAVTAKRRKASRPATA